MTLFVGGLRLPSNYCELSQHMPWLTLQTIPPARLVAQRFERLRKRIAGPEIGRQRLYKAAVDIRHRMKQPGKPVTHPIKWDSIRQKKAFFATDAFTIKGKRPKGYVNTHIPTKRSGDYQRAWKVVKTETGYDIGNPLSHSKYIGGTPRSTRRQSRIHRGRWPLFKRQIEIVIRKLPKSVRDFLKQIARQEGFRTSD